MGLKAQNLEFFFLPTNFFFEFGATQSPTCMIYILYCNILIHIFIKFQNIYTFSRLFSTDFVSLYIFNKGRSKFSLLSKTICALKG